MSYPNQPWQPQVPPPGPPPQHGGWQHGQPGGYPPGYGAPGPRINLGNVDRTKVAAVVVLVCGLIVLIGSLFGLYSVEVTPSALAVRNNDAPSGHITVDIGFYDVLPFAAPIVAEAIPALMVLAALIVAPSLFGPPRQPSATPAVFAGAATLLSIVLAISGPLPSVDLDGQLAARLRDKTGGQSINSMIDSVVSVSPGAGLIIAIVFSLIAWVSAASLLFRRNPQPAPPAGGPYGPAGFPVAPSYGQAPPPQNLAPPQHLSAPQNLSAPQHLAAPPNPAAPPNAASPW